MKRMIDTGTWDDPWFADLEPDTKLVFLYLLTNRRSTAAGAFEITIRAMSFETGIAQKRVESILDILQSRVQWWPEYQVIWVRKFFKHQAANENFTKSAQASVKEMPHAVQCAIGVLYPSLVRDGVTCPDATGTDTHPNGYATGNDTPSAVIDRGIDREIGEGRRVDGADAPPARKQSGILSDIQLERFERWYATYPKKRSRGDAERAWSKIRPSPDDRLVDAMIAKVDEWAGSWEWTKEGGQFIPNPATWLNNKRWTDGPPTQQPPGSLTRINGVDDPDAPIIPGPRGYTPDQMRRKADQERRRETA